MSNRYIAVAGDIIQVYVKAYRVVALRRPYHLVLEPVRENPPGSKKYVKAEEQGMYSLDWAEANGMPIAGATYRPT